MQNTFLEIQYFIYRIVINTVITLTTIFIGWVLWMGFKHKEKEL